MAHKQLVSQIQTIQELLGSFTSRIDDLPGPQRKILIRDVQLILETVKTLLDLVAEDLQSRGALTENDIPFRILADGMPALIWITDPDGQLAFVNRAWADRRPALRICQS